jgi:hypothetical protein
MPFVSDARIVTRMAMASNVELTFQALQAGEFRAEMSKLARRRSWHLHWRQQAAGAGNRTHSAKGSRKEEDFRADRTICSDIKETGKTVAKRTVKRTVK